MRWIAATLAAMLLAHASRALRWRAMLRSMQRVGAAHAFEAVMIGYGLNQILPRAGELLRPWVLAKRERLPASTLLATVAVERVIDVLTLALSLLIAPLIVGHKFTDAVVAIFTAESSAARAGSLEEVMLRLVVPMLAAVVVGLLLFFTRRGMRLTTALAGRLPGRWGERGKSMVERFAAGLHVVRTSGQVEAIAIYTLLVWIGYGLMVYFPLLALRSDAFGLTPADAYVLMAIITVGRSIAPTPGAVGVYHYFSIQAMMAMFGTQATDAAAVAVISHGVAFLAMIVIAGILWLGFSARRSSAPPQQGAG